MKKCQVDRVCPELVYVEDTTAGEATCLMTLLIDFSLVTPGESGKMSRLQGRNQLPPEGGGGGVKLVKVDFFPRGGQSPKILTFCSESG